MSDTYDQGNADPNTVPPLTRAIILAQPATVDGNRIGPTGSDKSLRAILDAIRALEARVIALGG
jgi:hypothetical protein